jgi:hypothetical protein
MERKAASFAKEQGAQIRTHSIQEAAMQKLVNDYR